MSSTNAAPSARDFGSTTQGGTALRAVALSEAQKHDPEARATQDRAINDHHRLTLRLATLNDLVPLTFFCDAMLRRDYFMRRGQLAEMIGGPRHRVLVAEIDFILVGLAVVTRGARLVNVLVHPAYRGLGIGRALVEASGAQEVRAKRDMSTGDPTPFYRSLGFESVGTAGPDERIVLMRKAEGDQGSGNGDRGKPSARRAT